LHKKDSLHQMKKGVWCDARYEYEPLALPGERQAFGRLDFYQAAG
jgi:hypothetical protein